MRARTGPREVTSIFLGGGTPSLMKPETVGAVLDAVAQQLDGAGWHRDHAGGQPLLGRGRALSRLSRGRRQPRLARRAGAERRDLRFLGRLHNVDEALHAIGLAREIFPRLSFDLIYARPGQTLEAWEAELEQAIGHAVDHLSLYQLTIEEGTPLPRAACGEEVHRPGR